MPPGPRTTRPPSLGACSLCFALLIALVQPTRADATDDRRSLVMLRILAYDKHLEDRAKKQVRILVVHADDDDGAAESARWIAAFAHARKLTVGGLPVVVVAHRFEDAKKLDRQLQDFPTAALVACNGLTARIAVGQLAALTRARNVLSITTREAEVVGGIALGIVRGRQRDEIVVNIPAAVAEGVKFDAGLLQLARTVEAPR